MRYLEFKKIGLIICLLSVSLVTVALAQDADADGVNDDVDLCPGTSVGVSVNAYGCPTALVACDYNSSSFTLASTTPQSGAVTKYILANSSDGKIIQIANSPSFSGLVGSKTYMALAYSYINDGSVVNLNVGNTLNQVSAVCDDWSNAKVVKVCSPFVESTDCDFNTSTITLNLSSSPTNPSGTTTRYLLVNAQGVITHISNSPTFTGLSGTHSYNAYAISYSGTINNLSVGNNFSDVDGSCLDWSNALPIKVCVCPTNLCIPVTTVVIK